MKNPSQDALQQQFDAAKACLERACPPEEGKRRAAVVGSAIGALMDYQDYLSDLESADEPAAACGGVRGQLAERAFEAEGELRILLAEGLSSLNDLRDSGMLHSSLNSFAQALHGGKVDFRKAANDSVKKVQEVLHLPAAFAQQALEIIERRAITAHYDPESETLVVRGKGPGAGVAETRIRTAPRAGDTGRIGLQHFFGSEGGFSFYPEPIGVERGDCHQRTGEIQSLNSIDSYSGMVGALASAREAMYRHARKVSQYGHGSMLRAQDPTVLMIVVLAVFIVSLIVAFIPGSPTFSFAGTSIPIAAAFAAVAVVAIILIMLFF